MADFDGNDDILEIKLPAWCADERMMSVLWIDFWLMTMQLGKVRITIFFRRCKQLHRRTDLI
jgi:hypothetical protein